MIVTSGIINRRKYYRHFRKAAFYNNSHKTQLKSTLMGKSRGLLLLLARVHHVSQSVGHVDDSLTPSSFSAMGGKC